MTARRLSVDNLPAWPRWLGLQLAAAYVGAGPDLFLREVQQGKWPKGERRGKGGLVTWDRKALDLASDALSLTPSDAPPDKEPTTDEQFREKLRAAAQKGRSQAGRKAA